MKYTSQAASVLGISADVPIQANIYHMYMMYADLPLWGGYEYSYMDPFVI